MTIINREIVTAEELAALEQEREGETVDFKGDVDVDEPWELAKDLAAFANHLGGALVIGAFENSTTGLPNLGGITPARATVVERAYENAAKDSCRPTPLITFEQIPWRSGRVMLVVNVRASLGFVCARAQSSNGWQFTVRTGSHNPPLSPEQAIMHMSTQARRTAIMLSELGNQTAIRIYFEHSMGKGVQSVSAEMQSFSITDNNVVFALTQSQVLNVCTVPLDDVETIWRQDGVCHMRVAGYFFHSTGSPTQVYLPRGSRPQ